MARKKMAICLGVGVLTVVMIGEANAYYRATSAARPELRSERREILNKRVELRRDLRELQRKRVDLRRNLRRGAPAPQIARHRSAPRHHYRGFYRDRGRVGWYRHPDGRWYRYPPYRYGWRR